MKTHRNTKLTPKTVTLSQSAILLTLIYMATSSTINLQSFGNGNYGSGQGNQFSGTGNVWNGNQNSIYGQDNGVNGNQNDINGQNNQISGNQNTVHGSGNIVVSGDDPSSQMMEQALKQNIENRFSGFNIEQRLSQHSSTVPQPPSSSSSPSGQGYAQQSPQYGNPGYSTQQSYQPSTGSQYGYNSYQQTPSLSNSWRFPSSNSYNKPTWPRSPFTGNSSPFGRSFQSTYSQFSQNYFPSQNSYQNTYSPSINSGVQTQYQNNNFAMSTEIRNMGQSNSGYSNLQNLRNMRRW